MDRRRVANWQTITLLNCDYKILTKAIALSLERHIPPLIHPDQSSFMQGRCIGENIRTIETAIDLIQSEATRGMVVALDFTKAFDSVRWDLIYAALSYFNFSHNFIELIKTLFICSQRRLYTKFLPSNARHQARLLSLALPL